jgi:DNA invertase Pin-like site-specific DNA recombinase
MNTPLRPIPRTTLPSGKIDDRHRERLAVVYVRQSTLQQVERHQESTRLQYALVEQAILLGWTHERVLLIDDDLGCSGTSVEGRPGFQRLVAEVSLGHIGLVLGVDVSRLARSCRDWHQLLEICALSGTLIGDSDGVYDPRAYNDRLLLGLKGTLSEAELHVLKARLYEGRLAKARRGEVAMPVPRGYVRRPSGEVVKDPDEQVRATIELVFDVFDRRRSLNGVLTYLVDHDIRLPDRERSGAAKGELVWRPPNRATLHNLLHNPIYAGAYVYGRRSVDPRRQRPGRPSTGRVTIEPENWNVLLKDRLPAYISWEQYERNLAQLSANRTHALNVPHGGPALLSGLLVCGRCGYRMAPAYCNNAHGLRYTCFRRAIDYGEPLCQSLVGGPLDDWVAEQILLALQPAAVDASLRLAEDVELERAAMHRHWEQRLERARHEVAQAERRYKAVDPDNRLVARTLERQWEDALAEQVRLGEEHARFLANQPARLTEAERTTIRCLSEDIPELWRATTTTAAERQAIARLLLERVVVTVEGNSEKVAVECHWAGGNRTGTILIRPVRRFDQLSTYEALLARVAALAGDGLSAPAIAERLNAEGWHPPKRRDTFNSPMVGTLLRRLGIVRYTRCSPALRVERRDADEYTVIELAAKLPIPEPTIHRWLLRGWLSARQTEIDGRPLWLIHADAGELDRLRDLHQRNIRGRRRKHPDDA